MILCKIMFSQSVLYSWTREIYDNLHFAFPYQITTYRVISPKQQKAFEMKFRFREENHLEQRKSEAEKIRTKYPDRIPVVVERVANSHIADIDKRKFLVPNDISVAQFMWIIRKRIQLPSEKAIFLFVNKTIPQSSSTMGQVYNTFKDEDGFLYIAYSGENTFGAQ